MSGEVREQRCETCRFWEDEDADVLKGEGECRARRPKMAGEIGATDDCLRDAVWPVTRHHQWCGEWQGKEGQSAGQSEPDRQQATYQTSLFEELRLAGHTKELHRKVGLVERYLGMLRSGYTEDQIKVMRDLNRRVTNGVRLCHEMLAFAAAKHRRETEANGAAPPTPPATTP